MLFGVAFAKSYKVEKVTGSVMFNNKKVEVGQILSSDDVLTFYKYSTIIFVGNYRTVLVNNKRTVKLADIIKAPIIDKSLKVTKSTVTDSDTKTTKGVPTAASRASDAKDDLDWSE